MNTEISKNELFAVTKQQIKMKILDTLRSVIDSQFDKVASFSGDHVGLGEYAAQYSMLKSITSRIDLLDNDEDLVDFQSRYSNEQCLATFKACDVDKRCNSDLQFFLRLLDSELDNSVTFTLLDARVNKDGLELITRLCVDGYCYESDNFHMKKTPPLPPKLTEIHTETRFDGPRKD